MESLLAKARAGRLTTEILPVNVTKLGLVSLNSNHTSFPDSWTFRLDDSSQDAASLRRAAHEIATLDIPVAFPTETVYGLGADATRSAAVRGIFAAKQRPSDNPLIVHVHSVDHVRALLQGFGNSNDLDLAKIQRHEKNLGRSTPALDTDTMQEDPIPQIYMPLIKRFWPGPLTLIMPLPRKSILAPEVTAGLTTVGIRMPSNMLALALIKLADLPIAAPSANSSSRPSPTTAEHVKHDLEGRISTILDGGACDVGVESTVVDGLSSPPRILRPGGVGLEDLRTCPGWENVTIGYKNMSDESAFQPIAPGMKYRHYSPNATVILYEWNRSQPSSADLLQRMGKNRSLGIIRTRTWPAACGLGTKSSSQTSEAGVRDNIVNGQPSSSTSRHISELSKESIPTAWHYHMSGDRDGTPLDLWDIDLGNESVKIARGLFSALRQLDELRVDAIFVEGIDDRLGDVAAAIMNRLRKAAEREQG